MKTSQFWYALPQNLIAQHPAEKRGTDRMMVLDRKTCFLHHRHIADIGEYINPGDILVVNDTKVFPARLIGHWSDTPGEVEILMVNAAPQDGILPACADSGDKALECNLWNCIVGSGRKTREGQTAVFGPRCELTARFVKPLQGIGMWQVSFESSRPLSQLLDEFGRTPVPPYVKREGTKEEEAEDRIRYQTVYAKNTGSVAAPTAGLHFTPEILDGLAKKGVGIFSVTLHVGPGTFRPVKAAEIEDHHMDFEAFTIPLETANAVNECKKRGGRVFCCGSTVVRTLESVANSSPDGSVQAVSGASDIFIYPPYKFKVCDAMLTNFHLPQSTLLMMVSALAGRERILSSYAIAISKGYRFFSYGDCMLIV